MILMAPHTVCRTDALTLWCGRASVAVDPPDCCLWPWALLAPFSAAQGLGVPYD